MKEWILEYTDVDEKRYNNLLNSSTINSNLYDELKDETEYTISYNHPFHRIGKFTYKKPSRIRCVFYGIKSDKKYYIYKDIKFRVLAETLFEKKDSYKKVLYSKKRVGTCVSKSLDIGLNLKDSKIVVAMCDEPFIKPRKRFLHAFVTYMNKEGIEYAIDGTQNIIMSKDTYLKLYNAKIISVISSEKVQNDIEFIKTQNLGNSIFMFEYLCFPEEVMEGAKKYIKTK